MTVFSFVSFSTHSQFNYHPVFECLSKVDIIRSINSFIQEVCWVNDHMAYELECFIILSYVCNCCFVEYSWTWICNAELTHFNLTSLGLLIKTVKVLAPKYAVLLFIYCCSFKVSMMLVTHHLLSFIFLSSIRKF